ncbi:MAG: PatB family C-S lyase, partial [Bacteroidales bacterium]|nr:PatB family C-S lyase [Bacteroidales bacterium]
MKYNFDEIIDRTNTNSVKFDLRKQLFGKKNIIPMWVADMDFKTPDFIVDTIIRRAQHEIFGYSFRPDSYLDALINWVKRRHNWQLKKEWIAFSPGVVPAINITIQAFTNINDNIIIQPPVYFPFFSAIENNKRKVLRNPLKLENGRYNIDFDDLAEKAPNAKMIILSNPHNPGGSVWRKDELLKLAEICIKNNVLIISDEIHCDLVFSNNHYTPMASISNEIANNTITFLAASKTFNIAGLATASVVCSNKLLLQKYKDIVEQLHVGYGNIFGFIATESAYKYGDI